MYPPYTPTPPPPDPQPDQTRMQYGLALALYLLRYNHIGVYQLTAEQLELAEYAAYYAVTAPEILPCAVDTISEIRHRILGELRARKDHQAAQLGTLTGATPATPPAPPPSTDGGYAATLQPPAPTRPPGGSYATPQPAPAPQPAPTSTRQPVTIAF